MTCKKSPKKKKVYSAQKNLNALLEKHKRGIRLDIGCGHNKQNGYIGLDISPVKGVDIVHDAEEVPYPLPDECCATILVSHLVEHICPKKFLSVMAEWWRLLQTGGQLLIATPYAGSFGFFQDPTHCNPCNEATWHYWDPNHPLYQIYKPKPFKVERNAWFENGNLEVVLQKLPISADGPKLRRVK